MKSRTGLAARTLALGLTLASLSVAAPAPAGATAAAGCPRGYQELSVAELHASGYRVPDQVDAEGSFGQPGNNDGVVCGVQLGNQLTPWGDPIFNFMDNSLP